jgi:zinc transporter ZupT
LKLITAFSGTISATLVYALSSQTESSNAQCHANTISSLSNMYTQEAQHQHSDFHHHPGSQRSFILPFTIGGFLYIALVGIIPEIVEEKDHSISLKQFFYFIVGVVFIFLLTKIEALLPYFIE